MPDYALGLDFGTNSARAVVVRLDTGDQIAVDVFAYPSGDDGIIESSRDPDLARQEPADYITACKSLLSSAMQKAQGADPQFDAGRVVGIGVDFTASTPMPVDVNGEPLAFREAFADVLGAKAWLWKDHTSHEEAKEITLLAEKEHPEYLAKCGGQYSSEWFWSKALRCARTAPDVIAAAHTWIEACDWVTGVLTGSASNPLRGICAAGHKAMANPGWGGYPDAPFLAKLHPELARIRASLPEELHPVGVCAGYLASSFAAPAGLGERVAVSVGAIDAHLGAVGAGIRQGRLVKIMGTSTCDMAVWPLEQTLQDIPGISGVVPESILPGMYGLEAGQSAVGDLFNWFVGPMNGGTHESLTSAASKLLPGESGLIALDWNNGNRCPYGDSRLRGVLIGQSLRTKPHEIYRALVEATAFGARQIIEIYEKHGVRVEEVVCTGGIAERNEWLLQVYADICGRPIRVSAVPHGSAHGAAICGAVAGGAFSSFSEAQSRLCPEPEESYEPDSNAVQTYDRLYRLYLDLGTAFSGRTSGADVGGVIKELLAIREDALSS
ncbi:ribulokinase [Fimbriimonadia bacterium ATM]|nr:MAG: ribulokinase [Armatimonadota bacterium]MBC6969632.1 ribulokinase [Armatimonadota bacterium]MCE7898901.1 ribulokinase [Armatimonadetes bacterium ATM1]MDL1929509.1 ribulokinase [Fimbriimonadia bacterium ATM]RIJ97884.1 MAG: ribulokinase [Armatimonadota bacterium]